MALARRGVSRRIVAYTLFPVAAALLAAACADGGRASREGQTSSALAPAGDGGTVGDGGDAAAPSPATSHWVRHDGVAPHRLDPGGATVVGGYSSAFTDYTTWEWDGVRWRQSAAGLPYPYSNQTLVYDSKCKQVISVGNGATWAGTFSPPKTPVVTMAWDGLTWTELPSLSNGTPLGDVAATYDTGRNRLVVLTSETTSRATPAHARTEPAS